LLKKEGLFVGSSSAMNCVGAVKAARALGPGHVIVTILSDWGTRRLTKFWNDEKLSQRGVQPTTDIISGNQRINQVVVEANHNTSLGFSQI
jgi:cysteine synthase A